MGERRLTSNEWLHRERTELRLVRERNGKTIKALAQELGVTRQYVYKVEAGERAPSHALMVRWVKILPGLAIAAFFIDAQNAA
jgi:transcriptional regulator with XRE-family HTH domain